MDTLSCRWTGHTPGHRVHEALERLSRTHAGLAAARTNLDAYLAKPKEQIDAEVVLRANQMIARLEHQRALRTWCVKWLRGW